MSELSDIIAKYKGDLVSVSRIAATKLYGGVVAKTPVMDGSAQISWTSSINKPMANNIDAKNSSDRNPSSAIINKMQLGDTYYLGNGQPYIRWLEYMQRRTKSGKTIYNRGQYGHMLSRTRTEWSQIVEQVVNEVKNGS